MTEINANLKDLQYKINKTTDKLKSIKKKEKTTFGTDSEDSDTELNSKNRQIKKLKKDLNQSPEKAKSTKKKVKNDEVANLIDKECQSKILLWVLYEKNLERLKTENSNAIKD